MRKAFLILPMVLAACGPAGTDTAATAGNEPTEIVAMVEDGDNVGSENAAAVSADALPSGPLPGRPCVDHPDQYDTCLVGKRGTPEKPCFEVTAYLNDPGARDVFARPDKGSKRLGRILGIPPGDDGRPVPFEVLDSRDGWLLIEGAADDPDLSGVNRPMYHGRGWIRGEGVDVSAHATQAFSKPDFASEIAVQGEWFDGSMRAVAILGCDGSWVHGRWEVPKEREHIRYREDAVVSRDPLVVDGWVTGVCPIMETTCDGLGGNRPGTGYDSFVP